ncbi:hypothetical protein BC940DRAFT_368085 [Gongronella butleri]|nr:hypothetical protein BC940DRAFT_368085 [Gongronella butleri]
MILLALLVLPIVSANWTFEINMVPPRLHNTAFNIATWMVPMEGYDSDAFDTVTVFSAIMMVSATLYAVLRLQQIHRASAQATQPLLSTIGRFNLAILGYLITSVVATLTFTFMNVGKIWSAFGVLHNLMEAAMLVTMTCRAAPKYDQSGQIVLFLYVMVIMAVVILLPWPLDALFFKWQGLVLDIALSLHLWRLVVHNRQAAALLPFSEEKGHAVTPVHRHLAILAVGATLHSLGNILVTMDNAMILWLIFQYMYAVVFPMYAFYCVIEPTGSRILWYEPSFPTEALITLISAIVATSSVVTGIIRSAMATHAAP